nr:hypothetical protein [Priestia aryabhattai]MDH3113741.1 hypothetical protein [Priestia aryabhattai]MDH3127355.1 hypothetical protein [Priestia aryabhattai]
MTVLTDKRKKGSGAFIQDDETKEVLSRALSYLKSGYSIHFTGPAGGGKTSLARALAKKEKASCDADARESRAQQQRFNWRFYGLYE